MSVYVLHVSTCLQLLSNEKHRFYLRIVGNTYPDFTEKAPFCRPFLHCWIEEKQPHVRFVQKIAEPFIGLLSAIYSIGVLTINAEKLYLGCILNINLLF